MKRKEELGRYTLTNKIQESMRQQTTLDDGVFIMFLFQM